MSGFLSKLSKPRYKEHGADNTHPPPVLSGSTRPSSPAGPSNTSTSLKAPKKGFRQSIRDRFSSRKQTPNEQQPPQHPPESNLPSQNETTLEAPEDPPQDEPLQSKRPDITLADDPHYQLKVNAIECSIQAIGLFEKLSEVISLVLPDAVGQALGIITKILTLLKQMVENREAWKSLLVSIDDKQRTFNEQLKDVQPRELPPRLVDALRNYAKSLEGLAARVMEQAGVVEKDAPKESRLAKIGGFAKRYLNANSDAEDIITYEKELSAIVGEVQTVLTIYISIVITRVDRKADNLKAMMFLQNIGGVRDQGQLGTTHGPCLQNTRVDILEEIRLWNQADGIDAKPIYCIRDVAGTGKSTIAYTMAEKWGPGRCLAFFFPNTNTSANDARILCISFANQIIACCYGTDWDAYWASLSSELVLPTSQSVENLWEKLVSRPLGKCVMHKHHVLVIDAPDECSKETRTRLLKCLLQSCTSTSQPLLRLLLTTRKESDICDVLERKEFRDAILLRSLRNSETSKEDVARYIEYRFSEDKVVGIKPEQRDNLVDRCNGLFIFAFHACNLVQKEGPGDQEPVLKELLAEFTSLDSLYHRTLEHVGSSSSRIQARLMNVLRVILVAREPLSINTITALLLENVQNVTDIVKKLGSILGSSGVDDPVYVLHATFNEFLLRTALTEKTDPETSTGKGNKMQNQYYIHKAEGEGALVKGCLSNVMARELKFNICHLETSCLLNEEITDMDDRVSKYISKSLRYSCVHWASHLESATLDADILDYLKNFTNNLFLPWLEVLSVTKRVGMAPKMLSILIEWMEKNNQDDGMPREMYRFVTTFASVIAQSAPHIYLSALPFAPQQSVLFERYIKLFPRMLGIKSGGFDNWPPTQNVLFGHTDDVTSTSFSLDGKRIVSGSADKTVRVWDAETGQAVGAPLQGHSDVVTSVAFSPNSKRIVSGSDDKTVRLWDAETGQTVGAPFQGHDDAVTSVAFSPNGKRIVSGSWDNTVRVWDTETGQAVGAPFEGHSNTVTSVAFSPDGKRIVSGSYDKTVRLWDAETGQAVGAPFEGHRNWVTSVAFSPNGKRIVSGSYDKTVRLWDSETGQTVGAPLQGHDDAVTSVAFSPNSKRIVSGSDDRTVRLWDAEIGQTVGAPFEGHNEPVTSVAFSPDGKRIVSGSWDNMVLVWDTETAQVVEAPIQGHSDWVRSVAFSPNGKRIVSGSYDKTVRVWDAATGQAVGAPFQGHDDVVTSVAFSPNGKRIVSGSYDKTVRLWDSETGQTVGALFEGHSSIVVSVAFSPNSKRIVSGSDDRTVRVWDAETEQAVGAPFEGHSSTVSSVAFSPDGKRIVSGSYDKTVRLWDAETGQAVGAPFEGHSEPVASVAFSPNSKRIVSGSYDMTVRVWDAETGQAVGTPFEGHSDPVASVAFSPNGKRIVSGSWDKTVRVWDAESGQTVVAPFKGHSNFVTSVVFSPDGKRIASSSDDKTVQTWDVGSDERDRVSSSVKSENGWILDSNSQRLFWAPPHILPGLIEGRVLLIIGLPLTTTVDLSNFVYGESWVQCKETRDQALGVK